MPKCQLVAVPLRSPEPVIRPFAVTVGNKNAKNTELISILSKAQVSLKKKKKKAPILASGVGLE